jgi:hypothetical protein
MTNEAASTPIRPYPRRSLPALEASGMSTIRIVGVALLLIGHVSRVWALGDVQVSVAKGKMTILGDEGPNSIQITPGIGTGAFVVTGVDGTAVNGAPSAGVTDVRKLKIEMKTGQDRVEVLSVDVDETLQVKMGKDQDTFLMDGGRVKGNLQVKAGKDGDSVTIRNGARVGGHLTIGTGNKNDTITINNASIGRGMTLTTGAGNDSVVVQFTGFDEGDEVEIKTGDGFDDLAFIDVNFEDDVDLELGDGDDDVLVEDCDFDGEIEADGGDGDDELDLSGDNSFDLGERRRVVDFEEFD